MTDPTPIEYLGDPLSDVSRRERRNLIITSALSALVAQTGLIPTQISALGIGFSPLAQTSFLIFLMVAIAYFLLAFVTYGLTDYLIWRHKYQDYLIRVERAIQNWTFEAQAAEDELSDSIPSNRWAYVASKPAAFFRIFFDFFLPVIIGIYAASVLFTKV
jgi:hypothetical protein